jgi:hypothetical protein
MHPRRGFAASIPITQKSDAYIQPILLAAIAGYPSVMYMLIFAELVDFSITSCYLDA